MEAKSQVQKDMNKLIEAGVAFVILATMGSGLMAAMYFVVG